MFSRRKTPRSQGKPRCVVPSVPGNDYAKAFVNAAVVYAASEEYRRLAAEAPSCFLFARIVEKTFADPQPAELLAKDLFLEAGLSVAGIFYAMASFQAEGSSWFWTDYAALGLEERAHCLEHVVWNRNYPETMLMAAYIRADACADWATSGTPKVNWPRSEAATRRVSRRKPPGTVIPKFIRPSTKSRIVKSN